MKIAHLVAGAGGMYCGSCLQGNTVCRAMQQAGHDTVLVPVYTPLKTDEENVSVGRVALGGLNVYLQQHSSAFRHTPSFVDRLLDRPGLLGRLGGGATRPEQLGALTVSMLRGEEGRQQKEIDKLVHWLGNEIRPNLVHLSTALLVGVTHAITSRLGIPVVATLSGEDGFIERLHEPYRTEAREELRTRCAELDALVAPSDYYAQFMADYLGVALERITVIRPGLDLEGHGVVPKPMVEEPELDADPNDTADLSVSDEQEQQDTLDEESQPDEPDEESSEMPEDDMPTQEMETITVEPEPPVPEKEPFRIGYFSRICPTKGLHQLVEAVRILLREPTLPPIRLVAAGHLGRGDRGYFRKIRRQLAHRGLADWFDYRGELDRRGKIAFLQSLDVLCVPATRPESKGIAVLEGLANGTPAVLPDQGVFSELIAETGGGLLYEPNRPSAMAKMLERMVRNPEMAQRCGQQGKEVIHRDYDARRTAEQMVELYRSLCGQ